MRKKIKKILSIFVVLACSVSVLHSNFSASANGEEYKEEGLKDIKNVIYMIGDGMGQNHVKAGEIYKGAPLHMQTISQTTYSLTRSANSEITDSAAGGTALATGVRTNNSMVGITPDGKELTTILDIASAQGKRTGVVTTDILSGATPMSFAAHYYTREASESLLASAANSGVNLFVANNGDSLGYFTDATGNLYTDATSVDDISAMTTDYVVADYSIKATAPAQSADESVGVAFDRVVREALEYLSQDPDGFVLMAEGAQIDKRSHDNNFHSMLNELFAFDDAVKVAMDWADAREDTVVIVTADHETGGLQIENDATKAMFDNREGYSWSSTDHTATNVYCKAYGVPVDFARFSSFNTSDYLKNTDIFEMAQTFVLGKQDVEVKVARTTIPYGKILFDKTAYSFGETVVITAKPNEGYELTSLKVNDVEMISSVQNNVMEYIINAKLVSVDAKFKKEATTTYAITYADLGGKGTYGVLKPASVVAGDKLVVSIVATEGYEIEKVTFAGEEMQKTSNGDYEISVTKAGTVEVVFKTVETAPTTSESSGCGSVVSAGFGASMVALGALALLFKRKR